MLDKFAELMEAFFALSETIINHIDQLDQLANTDLLLAHERLHTSELD